MKGIAALFFLCLPVFLTSAKTRGKRKFIGTWLSMSNPSTERITIEKEGRIFLVNRFVIKFNEQPQKNDTVQYSYTYKFKKGSLVNTRHVYENIEFISSSNHLRWFKNEWAKYTILH